MTRYAKRVRLLAAGLSGLAGFTDAIGFIALNGFFVSFMSGNTTRLAVGLAQGTHAAVIAIALIGLFVMGVVLGTLVRRLTRWRLAASVLVVEALLLAVAAVCGMSGFMRQAAAIMALAMGVENAVFERDGEVHIGLTYMTGTLVKVGQYITAALTGGPRWTWLSYLLLWLGLAGGAVVGALVFPWLGFAALGVASLAAFVFAGIAAKLLD